MTTSSSESDAANAKSRPRRRFAIIGGGITGLAAAVRLLKLRPGSEVVVFEAGSQTGGHIATETPPGFLIERGADSFITNKPAAVELCRELEIEDQLIPTNSQFRRSLVLRNGRPTPVPAGFSLLTPTKLLPIFRSSLFSWKGKLRIAGERSIPKIESDKEESLADFAIRRFGQEAFERLIQPMVGGIYTADPGKLSLAATLPRFIRMEQEHGSLITAAQESAPSTQDRTASGARYGLFATFKNGFVSLFNALEKRLEKDGATIQLNCRVESVSKSGPLWQVTSDRTADVSDLFDGVIMATPTYVASKLLSAVDQQLATGLSEIQYASTAVVASAYRLADVGHPANAFGLVIPAIENRRILAVSFSSRKFPGRAPDDQLLIRTFVGGAMQGHLLEQSDQELSRLVREELCDILNVSGKPTQSIVTRYNKAMPQYHIGHIDRVNRIEQAAATHSGLEFAGSAYRGVGIPDSIASGQSAAERILSQPRSVEAR